jgi:hypothetical protein
LSWVAVAVAIRDSSLLLCFLAVTRGYRAVMSLGAG